MVRKSVSASAQSDLSLRCPHEDTLQPWLPKLCPVKILFRLRECAVWSESSLGAHVRKYFIWRCKLLLCCYYKRSWTTDGSQRFRRSTDAEVCTQYEAGLCDSWIRIRLVSRRLRVRTPPGRQHSFVEIWSWNIFYCLSLCSADSIKGSCQ